MGLRRHTTIRVNRGACLLVLLLAAITVKAQPPSPPTITIDVFPIFPAPPLYPGLKNNLQFTIQNHLGNITGVGFTDTLPTGLVVATPSNLSGNCGGTLTAVAGSAAVSLAGVSLVAGQSCTFALD